MPKLYDYFGLVVLFYSNEHEPIHVHGKSRGCESKAELIIKDGVVVDIRSEPCEADALSRVRSCGILRL